MTASHSEFPPYDTPEEKEAYHNQTSVECELLDGAHGLFTNDDDDAGRVLDRSLCGQSRGMRVLAEWKKTGVTPLQSRRVPDDADVQDLALSRG